MPILFALFATLRGSPFADVPYLVNIKVLPSDQIAAVEPKPFKTAKHSIFITEKNHFPVIANLPGGTKIGSGETVKINLQTMNGDSYVNELKKYEDGPRFSPSWKVTKGDEIVQVSSDGTVNALAPGDATVEAKIPGLAAKSGFLFIKALGNVGFYVDGSIHWDIAILVASFGLTLVISQVLSGRGMPVNKQQSTANKITPVMITGMFLFFPLPAGVLLYMVIANIFQGLQTFLLSRESLPENLQKILDDQIKQQDKPSGSVNAEVLNDSDRLPFEPKSNK